MSRRRPTIKYVGTNTPDIDNYGAWFLVTGCSKKILVFYNQGLHETYLHVFSRNTKISEGIDGCPSFLDYQPLYSEGPMDFMVAQARALEIAAGERSEPEQ